MNNRSRWRYLAGVGLALLVAIATGVRGYWLLGMQYGVLGVVCVVVLALLALHGKSRERWLFAFAAGLASLAVSFPWIISADIAHFIQLQALERKVAAHCFDVRQSDGRFVDLTYETKQAKTVYVLVKGTVRDTAIFEEFRELLLTSGESINEFGITWDVCFANGERIRGSDRELFETRI